MPQSNTLPFRGYFSNPSRMTNVLAALSASGKVPEQDS